MSGHTPGPWAVNPFRAQVDCGQLDEDGDLIPVAQMLWPTELRSEAETWANARLIAAAPELLEALEVARESVFFAGTPEAVDMVDAAIAKARGGN